MKRTVALALAALLACLCLSACGEKTPGPEKSDALLTLYTDTRPLRIVTQERGVTVTLQLLEYEPTLGFLRPIADEWEETLEPGREYTIDKELAEGIPQHRLYARKENLIAVHDLVYDGKEGAQVFTLEGKPWAPAPIDENSPMIHLCRAAATVSPGGEEDPYTYWYAIACAISGLRAAELALGPDELVPREYDPDEYNGYYRVPEWLFDSYALALYPGMDVPPIGDYDLWVEYHPETRERWWVGGDAYDGGYRAEFKSARQNEDGTWDVTMAVISNYGDEEPYDKVVKLAPNEAYDPGSPFEYHIAGWPDWPEHEYDGPEFDGPPLPENFHGMWTGPVKRGHVAYLEICGDGTAGLYLGDDESTQIYEIYSGWMTEAPTEGSESEGIVAEMHVTCNWHIYESDDGTPIDIPDSYGGLYILRQYGEALQITAGLDADALFGKDELELFWIPKTLDGSHMVEIEAVG